MYHSHLVHDVITLQNIPIHRNVSKGHVHQMGFNVHLKLQFLKPKNYIYSSLNAIQMCSISVSLYYYKNIIKILQKRVMVYDVLNILIPL